MVLGARGRPWLGTRGSDIVVGFSVAALMLPEAVAYASIAGLPAASGLIAAIIGCCVYATVGRSRYAIVSPTSSSAAILAAILANLGAPAAARPGLAMCAVLLVGLFFLAAAVLRLGALASFVSRPVLRGFAFGLGVTITLRQIPAAIGIAPVSGNIAELARGILACLGKANPISAMIAAVALAVLLILRRFPAVPAGLIVLLGGVAASSLLDIYFARVALVGPIPIALPTSFLPVIDGPTAARLAQLTLPLVLILFAESWGTIRSLALRQGDPLKPGRELAALGLANLAAGFAHAMPVGAGFSAGSANESAGATSRFAAVAAGGALALAVLFARGWIALLPQPVLAAVVIGALTHTLNPAPLIRLWRIRRDAVIASVAAMSVLAFGIVDGMLLAILLSLISFIRRMAGQDVAKLGRLGTTHDFVDVARHPDAITSPTILICRPSQPLFFANAEAVLQRVGDLSIPRVRIVILSLEESHDLDSSALDGLIEFDHRLAQRGIMLLLARSRDHVRDLLAAAGATSLVERSHYSVADAVDAATRLEDQPDAA